MAKNKVLKKYKIYIDGKLYHSANSKNDAMWNLGAHFGAVKYNKMYDDGKIKFKKGSCSHNN